MGLIATIKARFSSKKSFEKNELMSMGAGERGKKK